MTSHPRFLQYEMTTMERTAIPATFYLLCGDMAINFFSDSMFVLKYRKEIRSRHLYQ